MSNKMYDGSRRKTKCLIFIIITFSFVFRREKFSSSASSFIRARAKIFARLIAKKRHNSRDNDCVIERCVWLIIIDETRVNHDDSPTSERRWVSVLRSVVASAYVLSWVRDRRKKEKKTITKKKIFCYIVHICKESS